MNESGNNLLFVTAEYPFGKGETFIENELPILAKHFKQIQIISLAESTEQTRRIPENVAVSRHPVKLNFLQKILAFRHIIQPEVRKELTRVKRVYGISRSKAVISTILFSWERARRIAKHIEPNITKNVICYAYWSDDSALALAQLKRTLPNITCGSRCHGWDVYFEASSIGYLPFREFLAEHLDGIFAISEVGRRYAQEHWKISNKHKFHTSRLGTTRRLLKYTPHQIKPTSLIVSCSNVIPLKRVDLIFEVLNRLEDTPIRWVHFGDGPDFKKIKTLTEEQKRPHLQIEWMGRTSNEEVLQFYLKEHPQLFVNLSKTEGIPVSIMEAMSVGIPVLATDVGGTGELVNDENGWLVDKNSSTEELTKLLQHILHLDQSILQAKSKNAFKTWEANFNAEKNFQAFAEELNSLI